MNYNIFTSTLKTQVHSIPFDKGLVFAIKISQELIPDYITFNKLYNWGHPQYLRDAIQLCEQSRSNAIDKEEILSMILKIEEVTPDMDDFGDLTATFALNACVSVYYSLQFLMDRDPSHLYNIGTSLTDTVDFRIQSEETLTEEQIETHPDMINAWNFIIGATNNT